MKTLDDLPIGPDRLRLEAFFRPIAIASERRYKMLTEARKRGRMHRTSQEADVAADVSRETSGD